MRRSLKPLIESEGLSFNFPRSTQASMTGYRDQMFGPRSVRIFRNSITNVLRCPSLASQDGLPSPCVLCRTARTSRPAEKNGLMQHRSLSPQVHFSYISDGLEGPSHKFQRSGV